MKLCAAQLQPVSGDISANLAKHLALIERGAAQGAEVIVFPELSLTGYEPHLAEKLATTIDDPRWTPLAEISDVRRVTIGVGVPLRCDTGVLIGMVWFQPDQPRMSYAKTLLHSDELPFFVAGQRQLILSQGVHRLASAICYESLQPAHAESAVSAGANVYLASVAKSAAGVAKARLHYPAIAKRHGLTVLMANCIGPCDNFLSVGQSAVWNSRGELVGQLDAEHEGVLVVDA